MFDKNIASEKVIEEFLKIAQIPRGSGNEEKMGEYLLSWAKEHSLFGERDEAGNVIIEKNAFFGFEGAPRVILQSHMDMVCVSEPGKKYDAEKDGVKVIREGHFLRADGTSLGADDGAGMAIILYILSDNSLKHGRIRAIFTVGEETSMEGAERLDVKALDAKYLINLDWEDFGSICSSCANNVFLSFDRKCPMVKNERRRAVKISFSNFLGGHSGCDINLGRANAIKLMAELVSRINDEGCEADISYFGGGTVKNAIPSRAECVLAADDILPIKNEAEKFSAEIRREFSGETEFVLEVSECDKPERVFSKEDGERLLSFLNILHSGVYYMSRYTKDFVETSENVGVSVAEGGRIHIEVLSRSSSRFHSNEMKRSGEALAKVFDFDLSIPNENPIWAESGENHLLRVMKKAFSECTGEDAEVVGVHAGLECAFFASVAQEVQMASIGPQLYDVHSPKERWDLSHLPETVHFTVRTLEMLGV